MAQGLECNWQHRALGLIIDMGDYGQARAFMEKLMACGDPPKPGPEENFIGLAVASATRGWAVEPLMAAGFKIKPSPVDGVGPMAILAYMACLGRMEVYGPLLPDVFACDEFLQPMCSYIETLPLDRSDRGDGRALMCVPNAQLLASVFEGLAPEDTKAISNCLSRALGHAIGVRSHSTASHLKQDFAWQQGYAILRHAGLFDLQDITDGILQDDGRNRARAIGFLNALEAKIVQDKLEARTPSADNMPRASRF